jgi:hypothetical protein
MVIPAAMNVESAVDMLKVIDKAVIDDQLKELREGLPGVNNDIEKGYLLGLQTARSVIRGNVAIGLAGIDAENIL